MLIAECMFLQDELNEVVALLVSDPKTGRSYLFQCILQYVKDSQKRSLVKVNFSG